jgi:hypothetical protein
MVQTPAMTRGRSASGGLIERDTHAAERSAVASDYSASPPVRSDGVAQIAIFPSRGSVDGAVRAERRRRFPLRLLSFLIFVAMPVALAGYYYFFVAADQYVAEFRFALRSVEPMRSEVSTIFQGSVAPSPVGVDS